MDIMKAISPKSDQLNADDLIAGEKIITITEVRIIAGEQPIIINYLGDNGKPWKPCKSMARVMVKAWGADANHFVGRSVKLFNDPTVKWGGMAVGGIRIAAMTDIDSPLIINLTASRGKRAPYKVEVLNHTPTDTLADLFNKCACMDDLRALWESLPADFKPQATEHKDAAKTRLGGQ